MLERVGSLSLVRFDPSALDVFSPSLGNNHSRPTTSEEALDSGALVVVDGPMFSRCDSASLTGTDAQRYAASQCSRVDYLLYGPNVSIRSTYPSNGATFSVVGSDVVVRSGNEADPAARVAVQTYPHIVRRGEVIASQDRDTSRTWRVALVLLEDGQLAFAIMAASMYDFARALAAIGAVEAGYLDGGGSGRIATSEGELVGSSENRRVGAWLVVRPPASGPAGAGLLVALAAAAGVAWWASRRRRATRRSSTG